MENKLAINKDAVLEIIKLSRPLVFSFRKLVKPSIDPLLLTSFDHENLTLKNSKKDEGKNCNI